MFVCALESPQLTWEVSNGDSENHESGGGRKLRRAAGGSRSPGPNSWTRTGAGGNLASGVCHTDLHAAEGDWPVKPTVPFIPGHEGAGIVAALGPGVTHLQEGDRVGIAWLHSACGHCEFCLSGWETLCREQKNSGYSVDGSFAQYAVAQADYLGRIPTQLSFVDAAPILCAGVTTYKGLKQTGTRPGEWVVISGAGGLGHVAIQYARAMGMHVAAVDLGPEKMALARSLGAEITIDAKTQDP